MNRPTSAALQQLLVQAVALHQQGQLAPALTLYQQVLDGAPGDFDALHLGGVAAAQAGQLQRAAAMLEKAVGIAPRHAQAYNNLGNVQQALGDVAGALASYDRACALNPDLVDAYFNKGVMQRRQRSWEAALQSLDSAIALQPGHAVALRQRGAVQLEMGGRDEVALAGLDAALAAGDEGVDLHFNRGLAQQRLGDAAAAKQSYERTLQLQPDHAAAHNNRAALLQRQGQFEAALQGYSQAIALRPDYAEAYNNRAAAYGELKQFEAALLDYDRALALRPDYEFVHGQRMHARMQVCDWRGFDEQRAELLERIAAGQPCTPPFALLALADEPLLQRRAAETYAARRFAQLGPALPAHAPGQRIRLGYFSADLHNHATAQLMAGMFEQHDRQRFELFAFSFGPPEEDAMRQRLRRCFDHFIDVRQQSPQQIAALSRRLLIDIAIDLKGFTKDSRPGIFAARAAPLQLSYLGYPGTLGSPWIDYLVADRVLIAPGSAAYYAEKIVYLPGSYQVNDAGRATASAPATRAQLGLPGRGFVFCCFNAGYKITPSQFDSWMRILQQVPGSVLWLLSGPGPAMQNLRAEARKRGVDADRLCFAAHLPPAEHLARQAAADLFLDTLPCNAHTTASDALWVGLPVLTCSGQGFAARVAASLLLSLELPELVTSSATAYEQMAVALAHDAARLAALRERLRQQRQCGALFDTRRFVRTIESAYRLIYERSQAGLAPEPLDLSQAC